MDVLNYLNQEELIELVKKLVSIPSHTLYPKREIEIAEYLYSVLKREGIECSLQRADGERCNVIARIKGKGNGYSLMLNGHTDTVPVEGMEAPFDPIIRDGYMYGRGTADMKSGVAAMLYAMIMIKRMGVELNGDLIFAGVIDEDAAKSTGSRVLVKEGPVTDYAIVGEPTLLSPVIAQKGIDYFVINVKGKAAHSSTPEIGANAIYAAADYIQEIREQLIPRYQNLHHELLGNPTINVGLISGCAEINKGFLTGESETFAGVVPDETHIYMDVRWLPCQTVEQIKNELSDLIPKVLAKNPGVEMSIEYIPLPRPAMEIEESEVLVQQLFDTVKEVSPETATCKGFLGFTDAGILYGSGGIKSLVFGPGDVAVAHSLDEKIEVSQIVKAAEIYAKTAMKVCQTEKKKE